MITKIRIRIFEIVTALIFILFSINDIYAVINYIKYFWGDFSDLTSERSYYYTIILECTAGSVIGIIIIFRNKMNILLKAVYFIPALFVIYKSEGINFLKSWDLLGIYPNKSYLFSYFGYTILLTITIIVSFLTINHSIKWQSRDSLLKYTYIMAGLYILLSFGIKDVQLICFAYLFIPCFMQKEISYKSILGLVGEIAYILSLIIPLVFLFFDIKQKRDTRIIFYGPFSLDGFIYSYKHDTLSNVMKYLSMFLLALSPLMVLDRQCAIEKQAAYELDKDPDDFHIRINDDEE